MFWSPVKNQVACTWERSTTLWLPDKDQREDLPDSEGFGVTWSPDGKMLAGGRGVVRVYSGQSGEQLKVLQGDDKISEPVAWSPDGLRLATRDDQHHIVVWDFAQTKPIHRLQGHTNEITHIQWSKDGTLLAAAAKDGAIQIWNTESGDRLPFNVQSPGAIYLLSFTPENRRLASGGNMPFQVWEIETGEQVRGPAIYNVTRIEYSDDGRRMYTLSEDNTFRVIDMALGELDDQRSGHLNAATWGRFDWSWKHDLVVTAGPGLQIHLWQPTTGLPLAAILMLGKHAVYLSPVGHYRAAENVNDDLIYVALTDDGRQRTLTPSEFAEQFGWRNDPLRVSLIGMSTDSAHRPIGAPGQSLHGTPVDLLALIDPDVDTISGTSRRENGGLILSGTDNEKHGVVEMPIMPPAEYRLELEVTRVDGPTGASLDIGLPGANHEVTAILDGFGGGVATLGEFRDQPSDTNDSARRGIRFKNGQNHRIVCTVRGNRIRVTVDDITAIDWRGDVTKLVRRQDVYPIRMPGQLYLAAYTYSFRIDSIKLIPLRGRIRLLRSEQID